MKAKQKLKPTTPSARTGRLKSGKQGEGGGRPKKQIDYSLVSRLAKIHCTQEEIAGITGISVDTLVKDEKFVGTYKRNLENGRMSVRRQQFKLLKKGNCTMAIWLGKQLLGQRDNVNTFVQNPDGSALAPISVSVTGGILPQPRINANQTEKVGS